MEALIALALLAIAGILFYRFVERRHKVIVGKWLIGLAVLLACTIGYVYTSAQRERAAYGRRLVAVQAKFILDSAVHPIPFIPDTNVVSRVSFQFCNSAADTVTAVTFYPKSLLRGRSTEYDFVLPSERFTYTPNELKSDYLIPPKSCTILTWTGRYGLRDFIVPGPVIAEFRTR